MRIFTLVLAFAGLVSTANAQTVVGLATPMDLENAGLSANKVGIPGGTVILDNEAGTFGVAYDDMWGTTNGYRNYIDVKVGYSDVITLGQGVTGSSNPTFVSYQEGVMSAGTVFKIDAKKDGWMTVFAKINPNKQYVVFEGRTGALAYTLGTAGSDYKIHYKMPAYTEGDEVGYIDFESPEASKYFVQAMKQMVSDDGTPLWVVDDNIVVSDVRPDGGSALMEDLPGQFKPNFPWIIAGLEMSPGESTGFLTFDVYAGNTYYIAALGSKMVCDGFVFTEGAVQPSVTFCATDDLPEVVFNGGEQTTLVDPSYTFPESFDVSLSDNALEYTQGENQGVYSISVSGKTIEKEVTLTLAVPNGWDGFIGMNDVDLTPDLDFSSVTRSEDPDFVPIDVLLEDGFKEGNSMTFPVDGEAHFGQLLLYKDGMADVANMISIEFNVEFDNEGELDSPNQAAYEKVIAQIDDLSKKYNQAVEEIMETHPDFDFSEWNEIIGGALDQAKEGAAQALAAANEDGEAFQFAFDGEEIEAMIAEMKKAPIVSENQAAYDEVMAKIEILQKEYEDTLYEARQAYPSYDFAEWTEIIGGALNQAKEGATQALAAANEDGVAFQYAFEGEDIIGMIAEMKKAPVLEANEAAYKETVAQLDKVQAEYEAAVAEIKETNPDFDLTEWEEIGTMIAEAKKYADIALNVANEEGEPFSNYFYGGAEEIEGIIAEMIKTANAPKFPESFVVTYNGRASLDLIEATQGEEDGVYTIKISGLSLEDQVTVALEVPAGWDGFVCMNEDDFSSDINPLTRAYEAEWTPVYELLENGFKESNQLTFATDGEEHLGVFMLVKDGEADEMNQIMVEFNVTNPTSGVAGVETIDDNARYYDFNGHQIARPAAGMYIKVLNGKASKVIIK